MPGDRRALTAEGDRMTLTQTDKLAAGQNGFYSSQLDRIEAKIDALTADLANVTGLFALIEASPMVQGMLGTGAAPSPMEMMRAMMGPKG